MKCRKCKRDLDPSEAYEYRGAISCTDHFEEVIEMRDHERSELMSEENNKTECFRNLDLSSSSLIGKTNRELLAQQIEIASKESARLKAYEDTIE